MGPHRDITGELAKANKRRGLKFITTFHHGFAWRYYEPSFAYDGADPRNALLYTEAHKPEAPPSKGYLDQWLAMVNEVVGKYQPDMIWFDFELMAVITPEYQRQMFADYYNWAASEPSRVGRGAQVPRDPPVHRHSGFRARPGGPARALSLADRHRPGRMVQQQTRGFVIEPSARAVSVSQG